MWTNVGMELLRQLARWSPRAQIPMDDPHSRFARSCDEGCGVPVDSLDQAETAFSLLMCYHPPAAASDSDIGPTGAAVTNAIEAFDQDFDVEGFSRSAMKELQELAEWVASGIFPSTRQDLLLHRLILGKRWGEDVPPPSDIWTEDMEAMVQGETTPIDYGRLNRVMNALEFLGGNNLLPDRDTPVTGTTVHEAILTLYRERPPGYKEC